MGKHQYKKPEPSHIRGLCVVCNKNPQKPKANEKFRPICSSCDKKLYDKNRNLRTELYKRPYIKHKKLVCESCSFIPVHSCQLDVDHIDGNHKNNSLDNLQTLCANCHRLKTYQGKDWRVSSES